VVHELTILAGICVSRISSFRFEISEIFTTRLTFKSLRTVFLVVEAHSIRHWLISVLPKAWGRRSGFLPTGVPGCRRWPWVAASREGCSRSVLSTVVDGVYVGLTRGLMIL
jgi:hypothetical protein